MQNKIEILNKILMSDKPSSKIMNNEDIIFNIVPELEKCKGFNQNNIWHVYDVYNHILHVIDNVPNNLILRYAALFHDLGKIYTYSLDEKNTGHFYNHYIKSKEIFDIFAKENNLDEKFSKIVSKLIYYHDINFDN